MIAVAGVSGSEDGRAAALLEFAVSRWTATPSMRIEDAYKWLYQATRGAEHAVSGRESVRTNLLREFESLGRAGSDEPEWQSLSPVHPIGRVNLRPYAARGGQIEDLIEEFIATAANFPSDPKYFESAWLGLSVFLEHGRIGSITIDDWRGFDNVMRPEAYPATHHGPEYRAALHPAYRVVYRENSNEI